MSKKKKITKKKKKPDHYVDNELFFVEMTAWKKLVTKASETDEPRPPITEYIGSCFVEIAERLSHRPNFINYEYRDEMVGDGIENCLMYAHNFDPEKSKNPFSYFTQIIYYAFLRRIQKEKKQMYVKYKLIEQIDKEHLFPRWVEDTEGVDTAESKNATADYYKLTEADIDKFIPKKEREKKEKERLKNKGITLDAFLKDDISEDSTDK
jgi:hypothetical protein